MLKHTIPSTPQDAATLIASQRAASGTRSEPRLLEWSQMDVSCKVQHDFTSGCVSDPGGTLSRTAHSRFRVAHGLSAIPQEVIVMRLNTQISNDNGGLGVNAKQLYATDLVEDDPSYADYNPVLGQDTTAYSLVCVNTTLPIADEKYSYFTIGFPVGLWPVIVQPGGAGDVSADVEVPEYCGAILSMDVNIWRGEPIGTGVAAPQLAIGAPCTPITVSASGNLDMYGPPININRTARGFGGTADRPILMNIFVGCRNGMMVTVRVISRLWDAPTKRGVFVSPGPEAHPAP